MKNRVKTYGRDFSSLDDLLKDIQERQNTLLDNHDLILSELQGKPLTEDGADIVKIFTFMRYYIEHNKGIAKTLPPLDYLFEVLKIADRLSKKTPEDRDNAFRKANPKLTPFLDMLFANIFTAEMGDFGGGTRGFSDEQMKYREDLFNRRNDLPKHNLYRRIFIEQYIDEEAYNRFYLDKEKEAGRYETEDEGENYTPEGARQWDDHFNALCKEYGEEDYIRNYSSPDEYYRNITPKDKLSSANYLNFTREILKDLKALGKEAGGEGLDDITI